MSVDFPEPDGPMIATYSPREIEKVRPRSACTCSAPLAYVLVTFCTSMTLSGLFITQRLYRIELGGAIRRIGSEDERYQCGKSDRDQDDFEPRDVAGNAGNPGDETLVHGEAERDAEQHARQAPERRK